MPFGITVCAIILLLIICKVFDPSSVLCIPKLPAIIMLALLIIFYIPAPYHVDGVSVYIVPALILLAYSVRLLIASRHVFRTLLLCAFTTCMLLLLTLAIPPIPKGFIYEPYIIYAILCGIICIAFYRNNASALFNSVISFFILDTILLVQQKTTILASQSFFTAVCISSLLSFVPCALRARTGLNFRYRRVLSQEIGSFTSKGKRKRNLK